MGGIYTALWTGTQPCGRVWAMKKQTTWKKELRVLARRLGGLGMVTHGTVQDRGHGLGGPVYQWTRKEKGKTVSVALSREQYEAMKEAAGNWKKAKPSCARWNDSPAAKYSETSPESAAPVPSPTKPSALTNQHSGQTLFCPPPSPQSSREAVALAFGFRRPLGWSLYVSGRSLRGLRGFV